MGCDCHMILQKKVKGKYVTIKEIDTGRDYSLFSILAGVRGHLNPISGPKGLPKDLLTYTEGVYGRDQCTDVPNEEPFWLGDHSFSYLDLAELRRYNWEKAIQKLGYDPVPEELRDLMAYGKNKYRIVFGFDS